MKRNLIINVVLFLLIISMSYAQEGSGGIEPGAGNSPVIEYIWILPDEGEGEGTQLQLTPGGERDDIYACLVVSDEESRDTIADVFVDVFHPDGSFKYQVHADWMNISDAASIEDCKDIARDHGLISSQDHQDIDYNIFSQQNWYMYKVYLPMYYHQPSGIYDIKAYAVDDQSKLSNPLNTTLEWLAGTYLELDFTEIEFGSVQPGAWKVLNGDLDMGTPESPTLKNQGNTEVMVGVEFSDFIGQEENPNKIIDEFDAQLRNMGTDNWGEIPGEHLEFRSNEQVWFTYPVSLCRQEKIDFSVHADIGIVPDTYNGNLTIYVQPNIVQSPVEVVETPFQTGGKRSVDVRSFKSLSLDECSTDDDCQDGWCEAGECKDTSQGSPQCEADCVICNAGVCEDIEPECEDDSDCDGFCNDGLCYEFIDDGDGTTDQDNETELSEPEHMPEFSSVGYGLIVILALIFIGSRRSA